MWIQIANRYPTRTGIYETEIGTALYENGVFYKLTLENNIREIYAGYVIRPTLWFEVPNAVGFNHIKNCPNIKCKTNDVKLKWKATMLSASIDFGISGKPPLESESPTTIYFVECNKCGTKGPWSFYKEQAISNWNTLLCREP